MSTIFHRSISVIEPLSKGNEEKINPRKSLKQFGKKKTVSFSTGISIIDVEKWKNYNVDVSTVGGCSSWDIKKNEERMKEEQQRRKKNEDGCVCIIF